MSLKVAVFGATGHTGSSIVQGLLDSPEQEFVCWPDLLSRTGQLTFRLRK